VVDKELKKLAGNTVMESDYSNSAKKQLLSFILNEASEEQLKVLILDCDIEKLDEDAKKFVNKRFDIIKEEEFKDFIYIIKEDLCDDMKEHQTQEMIEEQDYDLEMYEQITNFIVNEASDYQVLSMFFEGILPDETSNVEKEISLCEMAQNVAKDKNLNEFIITGSVVATGIIYTAYRVYKRLLTRKGRACAGAVDRKKCYIQFKANLIKRQIQMIKSGMSKCDKSKNPDKCKSKLKKQIDKLNARLAGTGEETREENR